MGPSSWRFFGTVVRIRSTLMSSLNFSFDHRLVGPGEAPKTKTNKQTKAKTDRRPQAPVVSVRSALASRFAVLRRPIRGRCGARVAPLRWGDGCGPQSQTVQESSEAVCRGRFGGRKHLNPPPKHRCLKSVLRLGHRTAFFLGPIPRFGAHGFACHVPSAFPASYGPTTVSCYRSALSVLPCGGALLLCAGAHIRSCPCTGRDNPNSVPLPGSSNTQSPLPCRPYYPENECIGGGVFGQRGHSAGTAPIITLFILGTPLKTTPLQKRA